MENKNCETSKSTVLGANWLPAFVKNHGDSIGFFLCTALTAHLTKQSISDKNFWMHQNKMSRITPIYLRKVPSLWRCLTCPLARLMPFLPSFLAWLLSEFACTHPYLMFWFSNFQHHMSTQQSLKDLNKLQSIVKETLPAIFGCINIEDEYFLSQTSKLFTGRQHSLFFRKHLLIQVKLK